MEINSLEGCIGDVKWGGFGRAIFSERRVREEQLDHSLGDII